MKRGPRSPLIKPMIMAPGITAVGVMSTTLIFPNLSEVAVQWLNSPWTKASAIAIVATAVVHDKKVFHSIEKVQYGFGLVSS